MKSIISKLLLRWCAYSLFIISFNNLVAQNLKFKLEFNDNAYLGTMSPKWYDEVQITPKGKDNKQLEGARGIMSGERFGILKFQIKKNNTGTTEKLMIKTNNGWYPVTNLEFRGDKMKMSFDWGFRARAKPIDLQVLKRADQLLSDKESWNKQDDRICDEDFVNEKWSLYCVLKQAYLDKTGDFNHRAPALNIVRQNISILNPNRKYSHQLMEFNNEHIFSDIKELLSICIRKMEDQLK